MRHLIPAICWAIAILGMATMARFGLIQREAATTLLIVMPLLAYVTIQRRGTCCPTVREA